MGEFDYEGPSHEEIWKKFASENLNEKLEGLIEAASEKANAEQDPEGALVYLETALEVVVKSDDPTEMAHVNMLLGMTHWRLNNFEASAASYEAGADAAKRGLKSEMEVNLLVSAGRCYRRMRAFDLMRRNFELALHLAQECDHSYKSLYKAEYGRYLRKVGDYATARVFLEQAHAEEPPGPSARAASELVRLLLAEGETQDALVYAREAFAAASYMNDSRGLNSSQFLLAQALVANGGAEEAIEFLEELRTRQVFGKIKHKVRVDVLYAEALMKNSEWDQALPLLAKAIPMLARERMLSDLGRAHALRSECYVVLGNMDGSANELLAAVSAFEQAQNLSAMCSSLLELGHMSMLAGDWEMVGVYALRVVDQVLMSFTPVYSQALGLYAISMARRGEAFVAEDAVSRIGDLSELSGLELAHRLHAQTLLVSGVRQRNLAAKAVKQYLLLGRDWMAKELIPLM